MIRNRRVRTCALLALSSIGVWLGGCPGSDSGSAGTGMATAGAGASGVSGGIAAGVAGSAGVTGIAGAAAGSGGALGIAGSSAGAAADGGMLDADAATNAGAPDDAAVPTCPAAPNGVSPEAARALEATNIVRAAAGAGCATMVQSINDGARKHCEYYAANRSMKSCVADAHAEVMTCSMFTGKGFSDRMKAAGYTGQPAFEVMGFQNNPERAVNQWIESVWHRIPMLNPWITELGYGNADNCDTIDFGRGTPMPDDTVVVYPYDGQTGLPTEFDGSHEGPEPPEPASGWPSGEVITVYAKKIMVTQHVLTKDGDSTPIPHVWLTSADSDFLRDDIMMYANSPLSPQTKYRVVITGTFIGGALNLDWTFTTK